MGTATDHRTLDIDAGKRLNQLLVLLIGIEVALVLADAILNVNSVIEIPSLRRLFNTTREDGLASWFGVTQSWMLGLTALFIWALSRDEETWRRIGWGILAGFFLYMAMDDGSKLHERIGSAVDYLNELESEADEVEPVFVSYTWQLVFLPVFGSLGLFMLWFLNRCLDSALEKRLVLYAMALLGIAVIMDFFEGMDMDHPNNVQAWIRDYWELSTYQVRHYGKSFEEFFEMLAFSLLWIVLLRHLVRRYPNLTLRFNNPPGDTI